MVSASHIKRNATRNASRSAATLERTRASFIALMPKNRDTFEARLARGRVLTVLIGEHEVARATWRQWLSLGWIYQIEGNTFGITPAYARLRW